MARTEPHGGQGRASEKGQAGRRLAPRWVQVTGAVVPPGWLTPAPLSHTQRPGLRWGSNSTSLGPQVRGLEEAPGLGAGVQRGCGSLFSRGAHGGTVSLGLQAPCLVLVFPYPNLGHCGVHRPLPILGYQGRWPISTQAPSGPRLSHHLLRAKLPCCRETLLVSGPHPFGQPLPRTYHAASQSLQGGLGVRGGGLQRAGHGRRRTGIWSHGGERGRRWLVTER